MNPFYFLVACSYLTVVFAASRSQTSEVCPDVHTLLTQSYEHDKRLSEIHRKLEFLVKKATPQ